MFHGWPRAVWLEYLWPATREQHRRRHAVNSRPRCPSPLHKASPSQLKSIIRCISPEPPGPSGRSCRLSASLASRTRC
eukprot:2646771-Pyramimonas_sp.AAC.1